MNEWSSVVILAVIQGISEFLPISSSGHLVLAKHFMGFHSPGILLEVLLHAGTLAAILVFYRHRVAALVKGVLRGTGDARSYGAAVFLGSLPALALYVATGLRIERAFEMPLLVAVLLVVTGIILLTVRWARVEKNPITAWRGVGIGLAQSVALFPGISRSGSTIVAARHLGMAPELAAEFSLLLSIPAQAGALVLELCKADSASLGSLSTGMLVAGFAVAGIVGYGAISCLVRVLRANRFWVFGLYCVAAGLLAAAFLV